MNFSMEHFLVTGKFVLEQVNAFHLHINCAVLLNVFVY